MTISNLSTENFRTSRLTPEVEGTHFFYGYYDNPAIDLSDRYQLCHQVDFYDRIPGASDVAGIGMVEMATGAYTRLAETTCWNFQQGSMLQWHPLVANEIIYNIREQGEARGAVMNIYTGEQRVLEKPVACVDSQGKHALSVSFSRMFDFRPGYGYAGISDPYGDQGHPEDDGVFLVDLATGKSRLVISLAKLWGFTGNHFKGEDQKILVNHITFNTDGTRILMLVRNFGKDGGNWRTAIVTANIDGSDLFLLSDYSRASHYHWKNEQELVIWSLGLEGSMLGEQLYELLDFTHEVRALDVNYFLNDGHCSYSPDRQWMLYDSYPDKDNLRHLFVYHIDRKEGHLLASYYSDPRITGDFRCDLHPRWNRAGTGITFDSIHEGRRHVYYTDLQELIGK